MALQIPRRAKRGKHNREHNHQRVRVGHRFRGEQQCHRVKGIQQIITDCGVIIAAQTVRPGIQQRAALPHRPLCLGKQRYILQRRVAAHKRIVPKRCHAADSKHNQQQGKRAKGRKQAENPFFSFHEKCVHRISVRSVRFSWYCAQSKNSAQKANLSIFRI